MQDIERPITAKAEQVRAKFQALLDKTNKENPHPKDVKALSDLLSDNRRLELWRDVMSAGHFAELTVIENAHATAAIKECWKHRLQGVEERPGQRGCSNARAALNTTRCVVLAEAYPNRVILLKFDKGFDNVNAWFVSGEAVINGSEAIHEGL